MRYSTLIRNAFVVTPAAVSRCDVAIDGERIVAVGPAIEGAASEVVEAGGLHLFPGVIDAHVHFNEPGRTAWEGIATGSAALALGGGTCFFDMPLNASPPTLDGPSFDLKLAACQASAQADFALWGGLTPHNLHQLETLAARGVIGFKAFMANSGIDDFAACDDLSLLRGMRIAAKLKLPVAVHAESETLTAALTAEARSTGRTGIADYLASRPVVAEVDAIRRAILFAQDTGCSLHIVHISSAAGSQEVIESRHLWRRDRAGPVAVTGETCPHYLLLSTVDARAIGAAAKCAPPLREPTERDALLAQLHSGGIDLVASDHSPAPASMKTASNFFEVWGGISGVQITLRALLTLDLPLPQVAQLLAANVATRFRLPHKGTIAVGNDADLALVDLSIESALTRHELGDRHKFSPYIGRTFRGRIQRTWLRGQTTARDGRVIDGIRGRLIRPEAKHVAG